MLLIIYYNRKIFCEKYILRQAEADYSMWLDGLVLTVIPLESAGCRPYDIFRKQNATVWNDIVLLRHFNVEMPRADTGRIGIGRITCICE